MKKRALLMFIIILFIMLSLPISAIAEMLDRYEDPAQIYTSGSFEATDGTKMQFSVEGGNLTGAKWGVVRHTTSYSLEGTFKEGEAITLAVKGTQAPVSEDLHVWNTMKAYLTFYDSDYKPIGEAVKYDSGTVKEGTLSYAMSNSVPPGTHEISASGIFTTRWANAFTVVNDSVAVYLALKPEKPPQEAMPVKPTATPEPEVEPTEPEETEQAQEELEPVVQVEDDPVSETEGEESTSVKTAAIIGIAATIAALGAAGAGGASGIAEAGSAGAESDGADDALEEAARQKTGDYRMVVYKTFGDTIEYDKPGQEVYARIESADPATGMWQYDNEKSMLGIVASLPRTEGLTLGPPSVIPGKGRGITFINKNPNPKTDAQAILSFRYTAPDGGYFERQLAFKLAGKPEIIIEKNTYLLSTEAHFDLPYSLKGCGKNPEISFSCPSGLVLADLSVGDEEKERFLRISPAEEAVQWDQTSFIKPVKCKLEVKYGIKPEDLVYAELEIGLCYEGIGTAYEGINTNKIPRNEDIINCVSESDERYKKGVWLPMLVMKWDEKARSLKHDTSLCEALEFEFELDKVSVDYSDSEKLAHAQSALEEAFPRRERTTQTRPAEYASPIDNKNKPITYVLYADKDAAGGVDPLPICVNVNSSDSALKPLMLQAKIKFSNDLRAYIKRFFAYSENTFARSFASFGNVNRYLAAMDFIEDRVYTVSNSPFAVRMNDNYYEHALEAEGYGDYFKSKLGGERVRSVVLKDECYPKSGNEMKNIQSLVHELTHAIEHINGSTEEAGGERHSYFLQYTSDVFNKLAEIERGVHADLKTALDYVVERIHMAYINEHNTDEPRELSWFGADMPPTQHYFIDKYIKEYPSYTNSQLSQERRQQIADVLASAYFPIDIMGYYSEGKGPFKGAVWTIIWKEGLLQKVFVTDNDTHYIRMVDKPKWCGGNQAVLKLQVEVSLKGKVDFTTLKGPSQEVFDVEINSETSKYYDMNNPNYEKRNDLVICWYPHKGIENSMLYGLTTGSCFKSPLTPSSRPSTYAGENTWLGNR